MDFFVGRWTKVAGNAIVNEAILTSESTPQRKTFQRKSPDGDCLAIVLRTGFETTRGKLMQTILFSMERVTVCQQLGGGLFISFLVVFAIIVVGLYVLRKGLEDPNRSRYKLLLSCSLIITSL